MKLNKEAIREYQKIYETEFNEEISIDEASQKASEFMRLLKVVYQPINKEDFLRNK